MAGRGEDGSGTTNGSLGGGDMVPARVRGKASRLAGFWSFDPLFDGRKKRPGVSPA